MKPIVRNGWQIYFHPIFFQQWQELLNQVQKLKVKLDPDKFVTHPQVKLLKALDVGIKEKIPQDPLASHFALVGSLRRFSRLKKDGFTVTIPIIFSCVSRTENHHFPVAWFSSQRRRSKRLLSGL